MSANIDGALEVSVILPTYNEAGNIVDLVDAVHEALASYDHEVIVVDDDSPDGTWRLIQERIDAGGDDRLRLIRRTRDRGLAASVSEGIRASRGAVLAWMDCDFSMPPSVLADLVAQMDDHDVAVGSRYVDGGRDARDPNPLRRAASRAITEFARLMLVRNFRDYTSGFIAVRREVAEALPLRGDYGEYFIDLIFRASRAGYSITEVPYALAPRRTGESKTDEGFLKKGSKYVGTIVKLRLAAALESRGRSRA